ncbi:MAG TPA: hypothetical protein VNZ52_15075 [Candidatus Thermoplasmatota archaeon]|nr:hypothetical protein [Candidatus Thermoplasmatota archaeon]
MKRWFEHDRTRRVAENLVLSLLIGGLLVGVGFLSPGYRYMAYPAAVAQGFLAVVLALYCAVASRAPATGAATA